MKLLTCYTPSHKIFLPQFLDTLDQEGLDVIIREHPQECPTGEFASEGWNRTTKRKFEFITELYISVSKNCKISKNGNQST